MDGQPRYPDTGDQAGAGAGRVPLTARQRWARVAVIVLVVAGLPLSWQHAAGRYLPTAASEVVYSVQHQPYTLPPWTGFGVFCGYAAAALTAGFVLINRRDA